MKYWGCSGSDRKKIFFQQPSDLKVFFLTEWLTDQLNNWMADWYTFGIEFLLPMSLSLCIKNAVSFTFSKSWFFLLKFILSKKLLEYLIIHAVRSKELAEIYALIPVSIFIDTLFRGYNLKLLDFSRISRNFAHFWKLNFKIKET